MRTIDTIESSYVARFEPRATGRTTKMIMSLPSASEVDGSLYIVGLHLDMANRIIRSIQKIRGHELASKCIPVASEHSFDRLRSVDPFNVFIDHTALEYGKVKDIQFLYSILDRQNIFQ